MNLVRHDQPHKWWIKRERERKKNGPVRILWPLQFKTHQPHSSITPWFHCDVTIASNILWVRLVYSPGCLCICVCVWISSKFISICLGITIKYKILRCFSLCSLHDLVSWFFAFFIIVFILCCCLCVCVFFAALPLLLSNDMIRSSWSYFFIQFRFISYKMFYGRMLWR